MAFLTSLRKPFVDSKESLFSKARWVAQAILSSPRKNLQVIAQSPGKSDHQALTHFLSGSKRDWTAVSDLVATHFYKLVERINAVANLCLIMDGSGIPKKGDQSAGVTRQYCGATGKADNCQVGVFAALSGGALVNIVKSVLYRPQSWIDLYRLPITFVVQIPESHRVPLTDFEWKVPQSKCKRGRPFTKLNPTRTLLSVTQYVERLKTSDWKKLAVPHSSTGVLKAYVHRVPVWLFDEQAVKKCRLTQLIRKDPNGDISFHLTNSTAHLPRLAYMQGELSM